MMIDHKAGSGDDDVFIQAAAIAGELNNDVATGKYHIVDESGPVGVRNISFQFIEFIRISKNFEY